MTDLGKVQRPVPDADRALVDQIVDRLAELVRLQRAVPHLVLVPRPRDERDGIELAGLGGGQ